MPFATVNDDHAVASGWLALPLTGRPVAFLKLATPGVPLRVGEPCRLEFQDGTTYDMTCARSAADGGFSKVVLFGGKARLEATLRAKHYEGIPLATIARDAILEAGETPGTLDLPGVAQRWTRREARLVDLLEALVLGGTRTWWVDARGQVNIGAPAWTERDAELTVIGDHPTADVYICAVNPAVTPRDTVTLERAGTSFAARASRVVHRIGSALRTEVSVGGGG